MLWIFFSVGSSNSSHSNSRDQSHRDERLETHLEAEQSEDEDEFIDNDIDNFAMNGRMVYLQRKLVAKYDDKLKAVEALKQAGFDDYVDETFNYNKINRLIRDFDEAGDPLPDEFDGILWPYEFFQIQSRKKKWNGGDKKIVLVVTIY